MSAEQQKRTRVSGNVIPFEVQVQSIQSLTSPEAEAAVLGAVLRDERVYAAVSEILQPADFSILWHGYVWFAFEQITNRSERIDLLTVSDELQARKWMSENDAARLSSLAANVPSAYSIESYARIVRDCALRIRLLQTAQAIVQATHDTQTYRTTEALVDECNRLLFAATDQQAQGVDTSIHGVIGSLLNAAEEVYGSGQTRGIRTGFSNLDELLRGAVPGELTVVAGAEGMGKTTFMLGMARHMAQAGAGVAVFTLEMSREEIGRIFVSMESGLPKRALKAFDFTPNQWGQFIDGAGKFQNWNTHVIDDFPSLTPIQLRRRLRTLIQAQRQQIDVVIIDGLWLMEDTERAKERHEAVRNITRDLIQVARDFNVPIYITHQYNGDAYHRTDKRPQLHDLAESAGVRRNAQVILGLYRDSYYGIKKMGGDVTELHILKDRNGSGAQGNHADFQFDAGHNLFLPALHGGMR